VAKELHVKSTRGSKRAPCAAGTLPVFNGEGNEHLREGAVTFSAGEQRGAQKRISIHQKRKDFLRESVHGPPISARLARKLAFSKTADADDRPLLHRAANKILKCSTGEIDRCGSTWCPRCSTRTAKRYRGRLHAAMLLRGATSPLGFVTATVACDDPAAGLALLNATFSALRRQQTWKHSIAGGESHAQLEPSSVGGRKRFNVHAHMIVELTTADLPSRVLADAWRKLLRVQGSRGTLRLERVRDDLASSFYVTRRTRKEWLDYADEDLADVVRSLPGKRLAKKFGSWRKNSVRREVTP
jgi:hypothetical protein